jgi:hypothetical protein
MLLVKRRTPYPRTWSVHPLLSGQRIQFLQILIQLPKEMVVAFEVSHNFNKCFRGLRAVWYFPLICNRSKKFAAQAYIFILYWVELGMGSGWSEMVRSLTSYRLWAIVLLHLRKKYIMYTLRNGGLTLTYSFKTKARISVTRSMIFSPKWKAKVSRMRKYWVAESLSSSMIKVSKSITLVL